MTLTCRCDGCGVGNIDTKIVTLLENGGSVSLCPNCILRFLHNLVPYKEFIAPIEARLRQTGVKYESN